ncbi:UNVERIFIED_CONTAM: hypothetical protein PYX00_004187 [Menopon gallinae]|uniref:Uncharacterized protein n=1 Tax=Menopon gallinae TaxID=328185 RepID=A0AAW2I473_9NEOP
MRSLLFAALLFVLQGSQSEGHLMSHQPQPQIVPVYVPQYQQQIMPVPQYIPQPQYITVPQYMPQPQMMHYPYKHHGGCYRGLMLDELIEEAELLENAAEELPMHDPR